jgi:mannose-1-phosphate guanylyltransferase
MVMTIRYGSSYRWAAPTRAALSVIGATLLQVALFGAAERALAADPQVHLTVLGTDARISRKSPYTITWTSADVPAKTALSLRLYWKMADSGVRIGGVVQSGDTSRLLTTLWDAATTKAFLEKFKSSIAVSTIESGKYVWDVAKFCAQNTEQGHSVCDSAPSFQLQLILRASDDPCADNVRCNSPRTLFKTELSRGAISFGE